MKHLSSWILIGCLGLGSSCSVENNDPGEPEEASCERACDELELCSPGDPCVLANGDCAGARLDVADCVNAADTCDEVNACIPSGGTGGSGAGAGGTSSRGGDSGASSGDCPGGNCTMICAGNASCSFACNVGTCTMRCEDDADCEFACTGGACTFVCDTTGECITNCVSGICSGD